MYAGLSMIKTPGILPKPSVWGPVVWSLLHAIGARAGKGPEKTRIDERRVFIWLIDNLDTVLPCQECRAHFREVRKKVVLEDNYAEWIWRLHEAVNEKLGKVGVPFTEDLGSGVNVKETWKIYKNLLHEYVLTNSTAMKEYTRGLGLWAGFAGV